MKLEDIKEIRLVKKINRVKFIVTVELERAAFRKAIDTTFDQKELEASIGAAIIRSLAFYDSGHNRGRII